MDWLKERDILISKCEDFRDFGHNDKFTKSARNKIVCENNYSCRYCGGVYPKYLICIYIPSLKCNDVVCRICYIITHLNYGLFDEVALYYSTIPQVEIIRNTVDYIIDNNDIPNPSNIDSNVKLAPLSLIEYINILNKYNTIPDELSNYKIFISNKLNLEFIVSNYRNKMIQFIDSNVINTKNNIHIETHTPTVEEINLFSNTFL